MRFLVVIFYWLCAIMVLWLSLHAERIEAHRIGRHLGGAVHDARGKAPGK